MPVFSPTGRRDAHPPHSRGGYAPTGLLPLRREAITGFRERLSSPDRRQNMIKKHSNKFGRTILMLAVVMSWLFAGLTRATAQDDKYEVIADHNEQYSVWPIGKPLQLGWFLEGKTGTRQECLDYIREHWADMNPQSLKKRKEMQEKTEENDSQPPSAPDTSKEKSLIEKLSGEDHPIEVGFASGVVNMRDALSRGYVNIKFTETGTELRMSLDKEACNFDKVDFENGKGPVHLEGTATLEGRKVRCLADFDVAKLYGAGHLVAD
jgi:MbtH protein